jgi:hypothetical protein
MMNPTNPNRVSSHIAPDERWEQFALLMADELAEHNVAEVMQTACFFMLMNICTDAQWANTLNTLLDGKMTP